MTTKIEPHVKLLAANIIQKLMPIEDGNEHVFYELCGIIADHAPVAPLEAENERLLECLRNQIIEWGQAISRIKDNIEVAGAVCPNKIRERELVGEARAFALAIYHIQAILNEGDKYD